MIDWNVGKVPVYLFGTIILQDRGDLSIDGLSPKFKAIMKCEKSKVFLQQIVKK
jgi:hypothetical protein